jgi:amidase
LALVLSIIAGVDWRDAAIVPMPLGDPRTVDLQSLRVAFHADNGIASPTKEIAEAVKRAAQVLDEAGAAVEEVRPGAIDQTYELYLGLFTADGGASIESLLKMAGTTKVHPLMQQALELQRAHAKSTVEFGALVARWDAFRHDMLSFIQKYDAILCPVCAFAGMEHGTTYDRLPAFTYTMTYNLTGWPGAVVRAGTSPEGLPIGVQIVARPWREDVALAVGKELETMLGGFKRPPL